MNGDRSIPRPRCHSSHQIGIDLGGTKIECILLDREGHELFRKRVPTPTDTKDNYKTVIERIHQLVNEAVDTAASSVNDYTIGVGIPGTLDKETGRVQDANTTWLAGHHFQADLEKKTGQDRYHG